MSDILYLTMAPIDESSGVYKKIISQALAFTQKGYRCRILFVRDSQDAYIREIDGTIRKIDLTNKEELNDIKAYLSGIVFCYARFELLRHKYYRKMIYLCLRKGVDIISEIPTYPPYQESLARAKDTYLKGSYLKALKTLLGTLLVIIDVYIITIYSKLVVLVADDKKFFFSKTIRIENGVDIDANPYQPKEFGEKLNIIAVSNFSVWNGYDRAIIGLKKYVDQTGNHDIKLIFVGDIGAGESLINQVVQLGLTEDVEFTGSLSGEGLDVVYAKSDIALGALGNHRRKVFANSSLKVKEYASRGMLMVLSDAEGIEREIRDVSIMLKSDESPVDFNIIKKWYNGIVNVQEIRQFIHLYAKNHYSWSSQIDKILQAL